MGALPFFKDSIFSEEYASRRGLLQCIGPRTKTILILFFILAALFTRNIAVLVCLYLVCLLLTALSSIKIGFFLKRTWFFIPIFSLCIAIPAVFTQGLYSASLFVMRVLVSVSFVVLLSLTTRHTVLLNVLRFFKVPRIFVMTIGMTYRYIYLFAEIIENTYLAIKSRTGGFKIHHTKGREIVSWNIATLWQRSAQLSEEVYQAMLSRGYTGEPKIWTDK